MNIGHTPELESYVSWVTVPGGTAENINIDAQKNINIRVGDSDGLFILMDENTDIIQRGFEKIMMDGELKKEPVQDYSEEIAQAKAEDQAQMESIKEQMRAEKAAEKARAEQEANQKIWSGLKNFAIGALCVGLAIATGGAAVVVAGAIVAGSVAMATGASNVVEGVTSKVNIAHGDYSGGFNPIRDGLLDGNQEIFDMLLYGSAFVSELFIGHFLPVKFPGNANFAKILGMQKMAASLSVISQGIDDLIRGEFSGVSSYLRSMENAAFNSLAIGVLPQPPCGNTFMAKFGQWAHQQGTGLGLNVFGQLTNTGTVDWERTLFTQGIGGISSAVGMGLSDQKVARFVGDVIGDTAGSIGYDSYNLYNNWDNLSDAEKAKGLDDLWKNGFSAMSSSIVTNSIQQRVACEPVDVVRGLLTETFTDILIASLGFDIKIERNYNSKNHKIGSLGQGWSFNLGTSIIKDEHVMLVVMPDAAIETFFYNGSEWLSLKADSKQFAINENFDNGEMSITHTNGLTYTYNKAGQLAQIEDRNKNNAIIKYFEDTENIQYLFKNDIQILEFSYSDNKISSIKDNIGRTVDYFYENNLLVRTKGQNGAVTRFEYNAERYLESITDGNGIKYVENKYDRLGRVIWQRFSGSEEVDITYNNALKENTFSYKSDGRKEVYKYNNSFLVTKITYTDDTTEEFDYDKHENKVRTKDRNGNVTKEIYDDYGNVIRRIYPDALEETFVYDEALNLIKEVKRNGQKILKEYDKTGNLVLLKEQLNFSDYAVTEYKYDSKGRAVSKTDPARNVFEYNYKGDHLTSPTEIRLPDKTIIQYEYDEVNRKISEQLGKAKTEYTYTENDDISKIIDPLGNITQMHYNPMGKMIIKISPRELANNESGAYFRYEYDSFDRLKKTIDPLGNVFANILDDWGRTVKEINPNNYDAETDNGYGLCYEYDVDGNRIKTIYPDGNILRAFYDSNKNKIKEVLPQNYKSENDDGLGKVFEYDSLNRLETVKNEFGQVTNRYVYNESGKVIKEINCKGYFSGKTDEERYGIEYEYDYSGRLLKKLEPKTEDSDGNILYRATSYSYDKNNNLVEELVSGEYVRKDESPSQYNKIQYSYNSLNKLIKVKDSTGSEIGYEYDERGNLTRESKKINELKHQITRYNYDLANRLVERKEIYRSEELAEPTREGNNGSESAVTSYEYDENGNCVLETLPDGTKIKREYNKANKLVKTIYYTDGESIKEEIISYDKCYNIIGKIDTNKNIEKFEYDILNNLIRTTDKEGHTKRFFYTASGKLQKEVRAKEYAKNGDDGKGRNYHYDIADRLIKITNELGQMVEQTDYNYDGEIARKKELSGLETNYHYDIGERIIAIETGKDGIYTTIQHNSYNALDSITETIDGENKKTSYALDKWGRIVKILKADGSHEVYQYDFAGNITSTIDGNGGKIKYIYNSFNKLAKIVDQTGLSEYLKYDKSGNLAYKKDRNGNEIKYTYDFEKNLTCKRSIGNESHAVVQNLYEYNFDGTLKSAINDGFKYTYKYDKNGRQTEKMNNGRLYQKYSFDENGNLKTQVDVSGKLTEYCYDAADNLISIRDDGIEKARYRYFENGNLAETILQNGIKTSYQYDEKNNIIRLLTSFKGGETLADNKYTYNNNGFQISKTENGKQTEYSYDEIGQIRKVIYNKDLEDEKNEKNETFKYDRVGNRISRQIEEESEEIYSYNAKNQLVKILKGNKETQYRYDNQGNIVEEISQNSTISYKYDAFNRTTERNSSDGNIIKNIYDPIGLRGAVERNGKLQHNVLHGWHVSATLDENHEIVNREIRGYELVSKEVLSEGETTSYFYSQNEHGDITFISNLENGVENHYDYDVFGNIVNQKENISNDFKYAGEQLEPDSQQYYLRARFYNPLVGRFTQEDVYRGDGLNLYVYVQNNPVLWVDPSGFASEELLENELDIGSYDSLNKSGGASKTGLTPHHMTSNDYLKRNYGILSDDGLCMMLETAYQNKGSRHSMTDTYGYMSNRAEYNNLSPRDALAYDIKNLKNVLQSQGLYDDYARSQIKKFIKLAENTAYTSDEGLIKKFGGKKIEGEYIFSKDYEDNKKNKNICPKS